MMQPAGEAKPSSLLLLATGGRKGWLMEDWLPDLLKEREVIVDEDAYVESDNIADDITMFRLFDKQVKHSSTLLLPLQRWLEKVSSWRRVEGQHDLHAFHHIRDLADDLIIMRCHYHWIIRYQTVFRDHFIVLKGEFSYQHHFVK